MSEVPASGEWSFSHPFTLGAIEKPTLRLPSQVANNKTWLERVEDYSDYPKTTDSPTGPINLLDENDPLVRSVRIRGVQWPMVANSGSSLVYSAEKGLASFYSDHKIATGEYYSSDALTAAHKTLPFGTIIRCTRTDTNQSVVVVVNDRGPYVKGRILDLSLAAAHEIGMVGDGVVPCKMDVLAYPLVETMGPKGNG